MHAFSNLKLLCIEKWVKLLWIKIYIFINLLISLRFLRFFEDNLVFGEDFA